jgi:hypothetical protein
MSDFSKILIGIVVFVVAVTFPFWYNLGKAAPAPQLELPKDQKTCVEPTAYMRTSHMRLLENWRGWVVRNGFREYQSSEGKTYEMSLQRTCQKCHTTKVNFCDRCHNYAGLTPVCFECHLTPVEPAQAKGGS